MTTRIPVKAIFDGSNVTALGEFVSGDSISTTYTDAKITSVAGQTGDISNAQLQAAVSGTGVLTTANVTEVTNLYFTNARSRAAISVSGDGSYDPGTGVITINATDLSSYATTTYVGTAISDLVAAAPSTLDTLNELAAALGNDNNFATSTATLIGAARDRANTAYVAATAGFDSGNTIGLSAAAGFDKANTSYVAATAGFDKANTAYVAAVASFDSSNTKIATVAGVTSTTVSNVQLVSGISQTGILNTSNVIEGSNLYYTIDRANTAIDNRVTKAFIDALNVDADTLDGLDSSAFALDTDLTTANVTELTNLYFTNARARAAISVSGDGSYNTSTGVITINTTDLSAYATTSYVNSEIANLVAAAPSTLDTLNELAAALGNDNNFASSTATLIGAARDRANTAYVAATAAFDSGNTISLSAAAGFNKANTAYVAATAGFDLGNTTSLSAAAGFNKANTAYLAATAGFDKANTAYVAATAAFDSGNTKVATVAGVTNTSITNVQIASGVSQTGILTTANVSELTNLYFTNARVYSNVTSIGYATNSNVALKANIVDLTTANVTELTNLYFTDTRVQSNVITYLTGSSVKTISGNLNITGNLNVAGGITTFTSNIVEIQDPMIYLGTGNSGDVNDIGIVGHFTNPDYQHTGFVRDASDGVWKLFANVATEPTNNTLDFTNATYSPIKIGALTASTGTFTGNVTLGNVSTTRTIATYSDVGTVQSGTWNGTSISTSYTDAKVVSVNGSTGVITGLATSADLTTANVAEVTNLYYSNARVYANVSQAGYAGIGDVLALAIALG